MITTLKEYGNYNLSVVSEILEVRQGYQCFLVKKAYFVIHAVDASMECGVYQVSGCLWYEPLEPRHTDYSSKAKIGPMVLNLGEILSPEAIAFLREHKVSLPEGEFNLEIPEGVYPVVYDF